MVCDGSYQIFIDLALPTRHIKQITPNWPKNFWNQCTGLGQQLAFIILLYFWCKWTWNFANIKSSHMCKMVPITCNSPESTKGNGIWLDLRHWLTFVSGVWCVVTWSCPVTQNFGVKSKTYPVYVTNVQCKSHLLVINLKSWLILCLCIQKFIAYKYMYRVLYLQNLLTLHVTFLEKKVLCGKKGYSLD